MATILGCVGAGGCGYLLCMALKLFLYKSLRTRMATMLVCVTLVDLGSAS
jgi:ABC-type phosphate/phosphonate transport system permease subunit